MGACSQHEPVISVLCGYSAIMVISILLFCSSSFIASFVTVNSVHSSHYCEWRILSAVPQYRSYSSSTTPNCSSSTGYIIDFPI